MNDIGLITYFGAVLFFRSHEAGRRVDERVGRNVVGHEATSTEQRRDEDENAAVRAKEMKCRHRVRARRSRRLYCPVFSINSSLH